MKKISTFFGLFLMIGMFYASAQTVPNSGFETWTNINTASSWKSNNNQIYYIRQSTDRHSGNYAAQVVTSAADLTGTGGNLSGILTLGVVNLTTQAVTGGVPISSKPTALTGYYKYTPGNSTDKMMVNVIMTKWTGSSRITLANAAFSSTAGQTISTYTMFTVPLTYNPNNITPDTFNITFKSSISTPYLGAKLLVDDLAFSTSTEIDETDIFTPSMWPNPANENVFFNLDGGPYNITVNNLIGQNVIFVSTNEKSYNLNTAKLPVGLYSVVLKSKSHSYSLKLLISR